jgi:hypothetical protein
VPAQFFLGLTDATNPPLVSFMFNNRYQIKHEISRPVFFTWYQSLHVDGCTFRNLTLPQNTEAQCVFDDAGAYGDNNIGGGDGSSTATPATGQQQQQEQLTSENRLIVIDGCANLMACLEETVCSITNSCVNQMEMTGQSMVFIEIPDTTKFYFNNNYMDVDVVGGGNIDLPDCELAAGPPKVLKSSGGGGEEEGDILAEEHNGGVFEDVLATATTFCLDDIKVFDNTTNVTSSDANAGGGGCGL